MSLDSRRWMYCVWFRLEEGRRGLRKGGGGGRFVILMAVRWDPPRRDEMGDDFILATCNMQHPHQNFCDRDKAKTSITRLTTDTAGVRFWKKFFFSFQKRNYRNPSNNKNLIFLIFIHNEH